MARTLLRRRVTADLTVPQLMVAHADLTGGLTHVDHLLQTFGTDSMEASQQLRFAAASVIPVVTNFTLQLL